MRRFQTLRFKLILPVLFILIIVFIASSITIINREYNKTRINIINNAESYASLSADSLIRNYETYYESGFYKYSEIVDNLLSLNNDLIELQIVDINGKILFESSEIDEGKYYENSQGKRNLTDSDLIKRIGSSDRTTVINENTNTIDIVQPYISEWGRHDYSIRYLFSLSSLEEMTKEMVFTITIYSIIFMIIAFLFIFLLFNRLITAPLGKIIKGVRKMSKGDLGYNVKINSKDELGELSIAFNNMSNALKDTQDQLKMYSANLEKQVNERTKELEEKNKYLEQINRDLNIARENLNTLNKNLENIVKQRTKEVDDLLRQKDDFINQLGHDLKTPLMPLTTLIPILEDKEKDPKRKEWLQVLNRNVDYMKNLVVKTIELAKLNSPKTKFLIENINLKNEIERIIENNKTIFENKKITLQNNITNNYKIKADRLRLEELIRNIIENSIKYNKIGGKIIIDAKKENEFVKISIQDTGIGMNQEQIKYIFDEFYKADSSRHDFDSIGLGLSICKKIVEKHGGKIWAESPGINQGTTLTFTIPLV